MTRFRNKITGEELSWLEFTSLVMAETARQFKENHGKFLSNLDVGEQIELCNKQLKHQLETDWEEI